MRFETYKVTERGRIYAVSGNYPLTEKILSKIIEERRLGYKTVKVLHASTTSREHTVVLLLDDITEESKCLSLDR